jgi:hypothetical protein
MTYDRTPARVDDPKDLAVLGQVTGSIETMQCCSFGFRTEPQAGLGAF